MPLRACGIELAMQASSECAPRDSASRSTSTCTLGETVAQFTKILPRALASSDSPSGAKIAYMAASSLTTVSTTSESSATRASDCGDLAAGLGCGLRGRLED